MGERLTKTQRIILCAAAQSPGGTVMFGEPDRRGTRIVGYDKLGCPVVIAYCSPEYFLLTRGMLERTNERYVFRITDAGRAALGPRRARADG